jgi:hypothetical protein
MAKVVPLRGLSRKDPLRSANKSKLIIHLPQYDDTGPLIVTITGLTAASIRRDALWAGKSPEQFILDWLSSYIPERRD